MKRFELMEKTLGALLDETAARFPNADAVVHPARGVRGTWREFAGDVDRMARGLMAAGVERGEKMAIWAPNIPQWLTAMFAAAKTGAVLVTVNTACRETELRYLLEQSGTGTLLVAGGQDRIATLRDVIPGMGNPGGAPLRAGLPHLRRGVALEGGGHAGMMDLAALEALADRVPEGALRERGAAVRPDDAVNMQYTSGTTGFSKGVLLSHRGILNNGYWIGRNLRLSRRDRVCLPVPLFHCLGCVIGVMACVNHGAAMVLVEAFSPARVLEAVQAERCTALYGVPSMYRALLRHRALGDYDLSSLRTGIMTGSVCPEDLVREVMERLHMPGLSLCYGLTEASPIMAQTRLSDGLRERVCSVGRPLPGISVAIIYPTTERRLPAGAVGEVCCRGYNVMMGYHGMPEATAQAIDARGWLHSGDLGFMDASGCLHIAGRIKDMIVRGGENVYPREVEAFLMRRGDLSDVQVVAVPSPRYGEEVGAFLIPRDGAMIRPEDVRAWCRGRIAGYKIPRYIAVVDAFPMTASGKVQKHRLRELAARYWA